MLCFSCWLTTERYFIWSFAGPVAVILFVSLLLPSLVPCLSFSTSPALTQQEFISSNCSLFTCLSSLRLNGSQLTSICIVKIIFSLEHCGHRAPSSSLRKRFLLHQHHHMFQYVQSIQGRGMRKQYDNPVVKRSLQTTATERSRDRISFGTTCTSFWTCRLFTGLAA